MILERIIGITKKSDYNHFGDVVLVCLVYNNVVSMYFSNDVV